MLLLLTAYLFFLVSFIAADQSITPKEKAQCVFSKPGNLPCASRKIYSLRGITACQSELSSSSGADSASAPWYCRFTSASPDKVWDAVAGAWAGGGAVSVKKHSKGQ